VAEAALGRLSNLRWLSDDDGLPWESTDGVMWRRPLGGYGLPDAPGVGLPTAYLAAEFGELHAVDDHGTDPWAKDGTS
jgi:hypothetical protein